MPRTPTRGSSSISRQPATCAARDRYAERDPAVARAFLAEYNRATEHARSFRSLVVHRANDV
jgi:hypothetical protein